jgi:hypothetical protein
MKVAVGRYQTSGALLAFAIDNQSSGECPSKTTEVTQDPLAVRLAPKQVQEKRHQISVERAVSSPQGEGREIGQTPRPPRPEATRAVTREAAMQAFARSWNREGP